MAEIWIVTADTDYEGFTNLKAFATKDAADSFADQCNGYNATMPECPPVEDSEENDRLWEEHAAAMRKWEAAHPAAGWHTGQFYTYRVHSIELERDSQGGGGEAVDAARYRWLREEVANAAIEGVSGAFVSIFTDDGIDVPEELDAAIDAARASLDGRMEG